MGRSLFKLPSTTTTAAATSSALTTLRTLHSAAARAQHQFARRTTHYHPTLLARLTHVLHEITTFVCRDSDRFFTYSCWSGGGGGGYRAKNVVALTHEAARLTGVLQTAVGALARAGGPAYTLSDGRRMERR